MTPRPRWMTWAAIAAAAVFFGNRGFRRLVSRAWQKRQMDKEVSALEREGADLRARLDAAKKGDAALERAARKELGYIKPGEVEYRFPPPAPAASPQP